MVFGTIFKRVMDEAKDEAEKKASSLYWVACPDCGRQVVKKELLSKGCYICGWQGTKEELEQPGNQSVNQRGQTNSSNPEESPVPYRIHCPQCGRRLIREEMLKNGCFICGYKA